MSLRRGARVIHVIQLQLLFSSGLMATSQTTPASSQAIATTVPSIARFSIQQYDRMIDAGVFECEPGCGGIFQCDLRWTMLMA